MATSTLTDWRSIEDDREKYQAYLCSHEWAKLKTAVHERAGGNCERCGQFPINAVHHLTYARKYAEGLEDLAGWCKHCHSFAHEKHWFDPKSGNCVVRYMQSCVKDGRRVTPFWLYEGNSCGYAIRDISFVLSLIDAGTSLLGSVDVVDDGSFLEQGLIALDAVLPFKYYGRPRPSEMPMGIWPEKFYEMAKFFDAGYAEFADIRRSDYCEE